jgi:hypothetical protein
MLLSIGCVSQGDLNDTIWLNGFFKPIEKNNAVFYRLITMKEENRYVVKDYYFDGKLQMQAEASQIYPKIINEGYAQYFNSEGFLDSKGFYSTGYKTGSWSKYFNSGQDSSVYTINENGSVSYLKRSPSQSREIYTKVPNNATFPGGEKSMYNFIYSNLGDYGNYVMATNLGGTCKVKFRIKKDGYLDSIGIYKSTGVEALDSISLVVIKKMPRWYPSIVNDKVYDCFHIASIEFAVRKIPLFLFNTDYQNSEYLKLKELIIQKRFEEALTQIQKCNVNESTVFLKSMLLKKLGRNKQAKKFALDNKQMLTRIQPHKLTGE